MAGKRQHYIWQMLQRGFSWQEHSDNHIWVYRNGVPPERTVTRKFGQSSNFYGPSGSDADENITKFENTTQSFIQDARKMEDGQFVDVNVSASLVAHLEMRSLFLRDEISRLSQRMIDFIRECMTSPKYYQEIMSAYIENHPEALDAEMDKAHIDQSIRPIIREYFLQAAPKLIRESAPKVADMANLLFDKLADNISEIARNAHNKALLQDFSEIKRTDSHRSLSFSILRSQNSDLILPDTSLAFFTRTGCTPVSSKDTLVEAVVVPLSVDVAIIGRRNPSFQRSMLTIRRALASCSYEAFLSSQINEDLVALSRRISRNAQLITESEIRSIVRLDRILKV